MDKNGWISVNERIPATNNSVLAFRSDGHIDSAWFFMDGWYPEGEEITHWMPLPNPPEES